MNALAPAPHRTNTLAELLAALTPDDVTIEHEGTHRLYVRRAGAVDPDYVLDLSDQDADVEVAMPTLQQRLGVLPPLSVLVAVQRRYASGEPDVTCRDCGTVLEKADDGRWKADPLATDDETCPGRFVESDDSTYPHRPLTLS